MQDEELTARLTRHGMYNGAAQAGIFGLALLVAVVAVVGRRPAYLIRPAIT
jgi:hypothetical protein